MSAFTGEYKEGMILRSDMDLETAPTDDFYRYVNGNWLDTNPVPTERTRWSSFDICSETILKDLHVIVKECKDSDGKANECVSRFWASAMDETRIETLGLAPIQPLLTAIDAVTTSEDLGPVLAKLNLVGIGAFLNFHVSGDFKNSNQEVFWLSGAGFGLPDRDYYLDENKKEQREQYLVYVAAMFKATGFGDGDVEKKAQAVFDIEEALAKVTLSRTDRMNPEKSYNPTTLEDVTSKLLPIGFESYARELGVWDRLTGDDVKDKGPLVLTTPEYFTYGLQRVLSEFSMADIQTYMRFCLFDAAAPYLTDELVQLSFDFHDRTLNGQTEQKPRWKRVLSMLQSEVSDGNALGRLYCEKHFPSTSKTLMLEYIDEILGALGDRLDVITWMSEKTKENAQRKLNAFKVKVGFPDEWQDMSTLNLENDDGFWTNIARSRVHSDQEKIKNVNLPPDLIKWQMPPQMVNAYFHPVKNEIVFPAAILQPPFFSKEYDPALAFGAIGAVIGHECTHGFDTMGRKFDHEGNLNDWWTPDDETNFLERAQVVIDQYNLFEVHGLNVNGDMTKGENIADIGGLKVAYVAMQRYFAKHGRQKPELLDGFTPEQRLFISWARVWRNNITEAFAKKLITVDVHSPGFARAMAVKNLSEFQKAFNVEEGHGMHLEEGLRADIW